MGAILIGAATSADIFAAALGISAGGIKFPIRSALASAFSGAAVLWLSALLSSMLDRMIPLDTAVYISKAILFIMGLYSIFGDKIKKMLPQRKNQRGCRIYHYAEVMNDPKISDCDNSKSISPAEGIAMGIALSADSVFMGISAGIAGYAPLMVFLSSLVFGTAAIALGTAIGKGLSERIKSLTSIPIGGMILIILALII
ncbi:MAG: manganese efflux pump [Huintestinicola sp.]